MVTCRSWKTQPSPSLCRERGFPTASYPLCRGADVPGGQSVIAGIHRAERGQKDSRPGAVQSPGPERSSPVQRACPEIACKTAVQPGLAPVALLT